jgi:hypothetical protein
MKRHAWGHEKASLVLGNETRGGVGFEECVAAIEDNRILDIVENENYPGQKMYVLDINSYAYVVPFVESDDEIFLKTMFPSRKFTKRYLRQ